MKKIIILALVLVCNLALFIPKSNALSASDLYNLCIADGFTLDTAEENGRLDEFFRDMNNMFLYTHATNKKYSTKQMKAFLDKGMEMADDYEDLYVYIALGGGFDLKYTDTIRYMLSRLYETRNDYAKNIIISPYDVDLTYSKEAKIEENFDPVNIGFWRTNTPIIFPFYVDETGNYKISINYSKRDVNGSRAPVQMYVFNAMPKNFSAKTLDSRDYFPFDLPNTGTWSNYVEKEVGNISLKKNNTYFMVLRDHDTDPKRCTMNLRNITLRILD